jgi:hypothetical protein
LQPGPTRGHFIFLALFLLIFPVVSGASLGSPIAVIISNPLLQIISQRVLVEIVLFAIVPFPAPGPGFVLDVGELLCDGGSLGAPLCGDFEGLAVFLEEPLDFFFDVFDLLLASEARERKRMLVCAVK